MENKKAVHRAEVAEAVKEFLLGLDALVNVVEEKYPTSKGILLDEAIAALKKHLARREESCAGAACEREKVPVPDGVDFGTALAYLKDGWKVARRGWNGKGQYVELAECISYRNRAGKIVNADHQAIGNAALAFVGTSGVQLGWLASQADMLAEDWYVVE